ADLQVIWRADVDVKVQSVEVVNRSLQLCPPSTLEALPVPVWAVRRWLQGEESDGGIADVPERPPASQRGLPANGRRALRYDNEVWTAVLPQRIQPGDTIVVPVSYGGCDRFGWNPLSRDDVADLGTQANYVQRRKGAIRITSDTLSNALVIESAFDR